MTFDLRKRLFVTIGIGAGILLAIILFVLFLSRLSSPGDAPVLPPTPSSTPVIQGATSTSSFGNDVPPYPTGTPVSVDPTDLYILQFASTFVEQFGTKSNQNKNRHIDDVLPLVTARMATWLEGQRQQERTTDDMYQGVTTRVITSSFLSLTDTSAQVSITAQQEYAYRVSSNVRYASGTVYLSKDSQNQWKVDGLFWEG